ncbi:MAG: threonine--tRNA ligase [Actinomycetota bacterium]|nr:threonine--tRNA ligase [Actinomycetota bacterium]
MSEEKIKVKFINGTEIELRKGITADEAIEYLSVEIEEPLIAEFNGEAIDLSRSLDGDGEIRFLSFESAKGMEAYRHTTSHIMAQAVKRLFKDVRLAIGPSIEDGFYYDFGLEKPLELENLSRIEEEMKRIVEEDIPITRKEIPREEAIDYFRDRGEDLKVELLHEIEGETVTLYEQGDFVDLCRGPHLKSTGRVRAFKLLSVAGAYWRGDESNEMLQRIYGTAFKSEEELIEFLHSREEAARRDHRKLGPQLDLFSIKEEIGPGLVLYHPKGAILRTAIEDFLKTEHTKRGYQLVISPHIMRKEIWKTSGHLQMNYPMYFFEIESQDYGIKPMNCPAHIYIYKTKTRGHRELPLRYFELGTVYRHERSGVLHGLLRVRGFTQDDAHIFCTMDQAKDEIENALDFAFCLLRSFGFNEFNIALSTKPEKYVGSDEDWERATGFLKDALCVSGIEYSIDPGEGVFYGPKIDVKLKDAIGRLWQGPTIQFDFNLPRRFDMTYIGEDNKEHVPVMIHRAMLGSLERFIGILIEHYAGAFPLWLAPVQVEILPIADRHVEYAFELKRIMEDERIRVEINKERETTANKVRKALQMKIPYMVIVGDKEVQSNTVSVRSLSNRDERNVEIKSFVDSLLSEIESKQSLRI